jgi:pantoate--beta-alanine ligase
LDRGVDVVVLPTVREADGLAMSSRNVRLNPEQRSAAAVVYQALSAARNTWQSGATGANALRSVARKVLESEPLLDGIDYVSVADPDTLEEVEQVSATGAMVSTAVRLGAIRIIDNVILG